MQGLCTALQVYASSRVQTIYGGTNEIMKVSKRCCAVRAGCTVLTVGADSPEHREGLEDRARCTNICIYINIYIYLMFAPENMESVSPVAD